MKFFKARTSERAGLPRCPQDPGRERAILQSGTVSQSGTVGQSDTVGLLPHQPPQSLSWCLQPGVSYREHFLPAATPHLPSADRMHVPWSRLPRAESRAQRPSCAGCAPRTWVSAIPEPKENHVQTARLALPPSDDGVEGVGLIMGHMRTAFLLTLP